jgi:hypothetical protein
MNKKVLVAISFLAIVMMVLPITAVFAASPMIEVSGTITSGGAVTPGKTAGENAFLSIDTASTWSGDISGSTTGFQTWIIHFAQGYPTPAHININVEIVFTTATVDGKTGTMTIEMTMIGYPTHPADAHGTWRIKDAAGGLEGLQGGGVWLQAPNRYEGKVHFSK